ncbi:DUF502 domain-containing protein [Halobacteria archaeon AArc-dxtr1]|nr:DUF502 domain-containing protein [Halobacteria archaeon AArc-dxtr1]
MGNLKRQFLSGLVVILPIGVTAFVGWYLYRLVAGLPAVQLIEPAALRVIVTVLTLGGLLVVAGHISRSLFGVILTSTMDSTADRVPGLRVVYNGSKTALEAVVENRATVESVKVEMWDDLRMTGFVADPEPVDGEVTVYVPLSPPTAVSGFVLSVAEEDVIETDESTGRAVVRVVTAGFAG